MKPDELYAFISLWTTFKKHIPPNIYSSKTRPEGLKAGQFGQFG